MPSDSTSVLSEKLAALRRRHVSVQTVTGLALVTILSLELFAFALFLDWWLELPRWVRFFAVFAQFSFGTCLFVLQVFIPWLRQPTEDELALMVERARPEFRSRLIATVQLARAGAAAPNTSLSLIGALRDETRSLAATMDFQSIVPVERLKVLGITALLVVLVSFAGTLAGGDITGALVRRALLSSEPVPRKTRIVVPEDDRLVGVGDNVRLEAFAQGILPRNGKVEVKYRSRRAQEFSLEQNRESLSHFGRTLENVQEDFTYLFTLGDGVSSTFNVRAVPRPAVATMQCEQVFPAYTGLKNVTRSLGDLSLLAGSRLNLKIAATKEVTFGELRLVGLESNVTLRLDVKNRHELTGQLRVPTKGLTGLQVQMIDPDGMEGRDAAVYRVDVLPDKTPVVRVTSPDRKEELVTQQAALLIGFDATDDFQIAELRLKFRMAGDGGVEKSVALDLEGAKAAKLRRRYEWRIAETMPEAREGSVIEYWLEAEDNNNVTGPGLGVSERQMVKVVSEAEKRADLLNRASDFLGSINDLVTDQEKLNRNLGDMIRAKTGMR
jgi:hypothetical protein